MNPGHWKPGQSGNPGGRGREKPFLDALRMELAAAAEGQKCIAKKGSLRWNARKLLESGEIGTIREIADRLDGRVPIAHEHAGAGGGPIQTLDLTNATAEQLNAIESLLGPVADAGGGSAEAREGGEGEEGAGP